LPFRSFKYDLGYALFLGQALPRKYDLLGRASPTAHQTAKPRRLTRINFG
jgi:hypothetical protein